MQKKFIGIFIVLLIMASLAGCMPVRRPAPTPTPAPGPAPVPTEPRTAKPEQVQGGMATRVTKLVDAMPEVKSSSALVVGNVAMVGVDLRDKLTAAKEDTLKTKISADTKKQMPELAQVWITSDPDLFTRIRDLARRIEQGEPITGFFDEISTIGKKLQPKSS